MEEIINQRTCHTCHIPQDIDTQFNTHSGSKKNICKNCIKQSNAERYRRVKLATPDVYKYHAVYPTKGRPIIQRTYEEKLAHMEEQRIKHLLQIKLKKQKVKEEKLNSELLL